MVSTTCMTGEHIIAVACSADFFYFHCWDNYSISIYCDVRYVMSYIFVTYLAMRPPQLFCRPCVAIRRVVLDCLSLHSVTGDVRPRAQRSVSSNRLLYVYAYEQGNGHYQSTLNRIEKSGRKRQLKFRILINYRYGYGFNWMASLAQRHI